MKYTLPILILSLLISCTPGKSSKSESTAGPTGAPTSNEDSSSYLNLEKIERNVVVRTFNEYNSALSLATGVPISHENVVTEFNAIKNSLPSNNSAQTFSSFSQVSALRLSFSYCDVYMNTSEIWKDFDFDNGSDSQILNNLMENLLDYNSKKASDVAKYSDLKTKLDDIIKNKPVDGQVLVQSTDGGPGTVKKRLTTMACSAILSSSYYTTH